jgi:hypothetical protein
MIHIIGGNHNVITHHHPPIPAPSRVESLQAKQLHLKATDIARLSILILSKTYRSKNYL